MKKYSLLLTLFCTVLITAAGANDSVDRAFELRADAVGFEAYEGRTLNETFTRADVRKLDFRGIAPLRDVALDEADYEPNDWNGATWPPAPWGGAIGVLPAMEGTVLSGALDTIDFDGWYAGDDDLFGFSLPGEGMLDILVEFTPDCSVENIYNVWFMAEADDGMLYILELNFPYPSVAPVVCPFVGSYTMDPYGELEPGIYFTNQFFIYIGGVDGALPEYTITWYFSDCADLDADGYYDEACGGLDCNDHDPYMHPCALEIPGSGIDEDCSGTDRVLNGGEVSEIEPNDTSGTAQDLGALAAGDCFEIEGNYCSDSDSDYYLFDLPPLGITLTLTMLYEGITEELDCYIVEGEDDYWVGIMPGDLDGDGFYDVGDYRLTLCAAAAADADGDGWHSEESCGADCDDTDPAVHPCDPETPAACGDGTDQDCVGIQETLHSITEGALYPAPDLDLTCDGIDEIEPNDDLASGVVHDLGLLTEGITTVYGSLTTIGMEGDLDFYQFELPNAGFFYVQMMFDCDNDYDLLFLAYFDPDGPEGMAYELDWWIVDGDAWIYVPETVGGPIIEGGGWEFPVDFAVWIYGYDGDPGYYYFELFWDSACIDGDADGDGYCGGVDPTFEEIYHVIGECAEDCDDGDAAVNPGADEICGNGIDDDCDGDIDEPDCVPTDDFILELDASYAWSRLRLVYTIQTPEEAIWATFLILTQPSVQVIPLWSVPLPVISSPITQSISFPFPSMGMVGIFSGLFTAGGLEASDLEWVNTG